MESYFLSF